MAAAIVEWLDVVDRYYLSNFIKSGGSAFKLQLAPHGGSVTGVLDEVKSLARKNGFIYVQVSADETRIDKVDQLFFAIAKQIDWEALVAKDAANFLRSRDYEVPEGVQPSDITAIAEANDTEQEDLLRDIRRATRQEILQDRRMCKEFRTAVAELRRAQFFPRSVTPTDAETLSGWLQGEKVSAASLRDLRIYSKISRHNAREMIIALSHWLAKSLGMGLVIGLDLSALLLTRPQAASDGTRIEQTTLHYSRSALLDAYEVIRQFIDETDDITHCFICAAAPPEIETDEKRSIFRYYALQSRLLSEVRDPNRQNLLGAMVRLDEVSAEGVAVGE